MRTPSSLQDAAVGPSRLALIAVLVLLAAAAVVLGGRVAYAKATAAPQPAPSLLPTAGASTSGALASRSTPPGLASAAPDGASAAAPSAGGGGTAPGPLVVHVVGQVEHPGVVRLPPGSRVQDAVTAAGGPLRMADLARVNLARPLVDGEQVLVPKPGQEIPDAPAGGAPGVGAAAPPVVSGSGAGSPGAGGAGQASTGPVNLNTADVAALDGLPGVGPVIAQRILQWRTQNGRFTSVEELGEVSGIGDKLMEQLRPLVTV